MNRLIVIACAMLLLGSCQSYRWINIESCVPAEMVFPPEIKTVMVMNNAAQQPDAMGHRKQVYAQTDSDVSLSVDSMAYFFCKALGEAIAESPLFDDVRLCEDTLRWDSLFFRTEPFTPDEVTTLCTNYGVDALVSLDRFMLRSIIYDVSRQPVYKQEFYRAFLDFYRVYLNGEVRVLWPGQKDAYLFPFSDSLAYRAYEYSLLYDDHFQASEEDVREGLRRLSEYVAQVISESLVPFWVADERWYYTRSSLAWKQGSVFAGAEKWAEAAEKWKSLYEIETKWRRRARLASNLALCYEMLGDFDKAVVYAGTSHELYMKHTDPENEFVRMQADYLTLLKKRQAQDAKLSEQLHEK